MGSSSTAYDRFSSSLHPWYLDYGYPTIDQGEDEISNDPIVVPEQNSSNRLEQNVAESRNLTSQIIASIKLPSETIYFRPLIIQMFKALPQLQCKKLLVQNFMYNLNELIKRLMLVWLSYSSLEDDARAPVYFAECRATLEHIQDVTRNCPVPSLQMEHLDNFMFGSSSALPTPAPSPMQVKCATVVYHQSASTQNSPF